MAMIQMFLLYDVTSIENAVESVLRPVICPEILFLFFVVKRILQHF